ncbi:hypothetical protein DEO72_LG3g646 [Vigna unguiculata]|uniref:Uncharacterized protein n=1 Tax=Vigna unguiculata TaxID=3917 RepID=A0A4D6LCP5_VIGUN|nr:hypothetical protein DEO72_LG3g646 [Vigna unguiculata]
MMRCTMKRMNKYKNKCKGKEFPGVVFHSNSDLQQPQHNYIILKANVECMHMIQVGLTLSNFEGNLPSF